MTLVEPTGPRYTVEETGEGLTVTVPARKRWFLIFFLGFWLVGWAVGEVAVISILIAGALGAFGAEGVESAPPVGDAGPFAGFIGVFLVAWLGAWTVGGVVAIYSWLWLVAGREVLVFSVDRLRVEKRVPVWTRTREYRLGEIKRLRVEAGSRGSALWWSNDPYGMWRGTLAFDYGAKTFRIGTGLEEAEARMILEEIARRHPEIVEGGPEGADG